MPFNISDFIHATQDGFAREAHFEAVIQLPKSLTGDVVTPSPFTEALRRTAGTQILGFDIGLGGLANSIDGLRAPPAAQASPSQIRQLSLLCAGATLPGRNIETTSVNRYGQGFRQAFAVGTQYEPLSLEFYCDARAENLKLLHTWMDSIFSFDNDTFQQVEYSDNYTSSMSLIQYNTSGSQIAEWQFEEIFPMSLPSISFNWAARGSFIVLQATFGYAKYSQLKAPTTSTRVSDSFRKASSNQLDARSVLPL